MKKIFLITLIDGQVYEIDATQIIKDLPLFARANHPKIMLIASELAREGFSPDVKADSPVWIAPSQIKSVRPVFEVPKVEEVITPNPEM